MTMVIPHVASAEAEEREPPFSPAIVEGWLQVLGKAVRAHQLYLPNNPIYQRSIEQLRMSFEALWSETDEVTLSITESDLKWEGRVVASETSKTESLAWLLYKDGLRELTLTRGFETDELERFLDLLQRVRRALPDDDDLLTLLWEQDFINMRYRFVEIAPEGVEVIEAGEGYGEERTVDVAGTEAAAAVEQAPGIVSMKDFDSAIYFLDESEIEFVRNAVQAEYESDLARNVLSILLDVWERQAADDVRKEVVEALQLLVLHFLAAGNYRAVSYLVDEIGVAVERGVDVHPRHREDVLGVPSQLGNPVVLGQLLQSLADSEHAPDTDELDALFEVLGGAAMETVIRWTVRLQPGPLRAALERAATRLAVTNTNDLVQLIGSSDREVAHQAARRAGELKSPAAVSMLGRLLGGKDAELRQAAALALAEIGSPGALQHLERVVGDPDREVRVAAVRILGARGHRAALPKLEAQVKSADMRDADLTEKMAYFEAYGAMAGDKAVSHLDGVLNGRSLFGRRDDAETRACAAMALGRIGTTSALDAVRKAAQDKEMIVRNAVAKALRGSRQ